MFIERIKRDYEHEHKEITKRERSLVMQYVGQKFDVEITVLAESGTPYEHLDKVRDGSESKVYQSIVPEGSDYIWVRSRDTDLTPFWNEVKKLLDSNPDEINNPQLSLTIKAYQEKRDAKA